MSDDDGFQMSFRLPSDLHLPCKELAEKNGQTFAEWIRRAMREKYERDTAATQEMDKIKADYEELKADYELLQNMHNNSEKELHDIIKKVILDMKEQKVI